MLVAMAAGAAGAQRDDVLLHLPFDGDAGAQSTVHGNCQYIEGMRGKAIVVGGADRVTYPAAEHFDPTQGACSFWAAPVDWTPQVGTFQFLVSFLSGSANTDLLLYKLHQAPTLTMLVRNSDSKAQTLDKPIVSWRRGQWHHIAATWGAEGYRFYVDGEMVGERPAIQLPPAPWATITVGTAYPHWGMLGEKKTAIDDLRIYREPLSAEQVLKQFTVQRDASEVLRREAEERRAMIEKIRTSNLAQAARGGAVFTSSFADYKAGYSDNLIDGDLDSVWRSFDDELPQWIELRWAYPVRVSSLAFTEIEPSRITNWSIKAWDRIGAWRNVVEGKGGAERVETAFDEIETDRLRLIITGNDGPVTQISEIEAYGPQGQINVDDLRPFWHGWHLWYPEPEEKVILEPRYFRTTFDVDQPVDSAYFQLYTNDLYEVYLNGQKVVDGFKYQPSIDVTQSIKPGRNCLAIIATPTSQPRWTHMAMTCDLTLNTDQGTHFIATQESWKCSRAAAAGWKQADFDDASWSQPFMIAPVGQAVWGRLSYEDKSDRTPVVLRKVQLPTAAAKPGDTVTVRLHLRPAQPLHSDHVLVYKLAETSVLAGWGDYTVCQGTVTPGRTSTWPTDRDTVVDIAVPLPVWTPHGETPLRVEGLGLTDGVGLSLVDPDGKPVDVVARLRVDRFGGEIVHPPTATKSRVTHDRPVKAFEIDGRAVPPLVHCYTGPSYERLYLSSTTDVHLYQARAYPLQFDGTESSARRLRQLLEQHITQTVRIDHEARFIVFLDMRPSAKWLKKHPEAALKTAFGKDGPQSYFSREHEALQVNNLRDLVHDLERKPYASRIFAYHIITCGTPDSALGGVEDNLFVSDRDKLTLGDYNPQAIGAFQQWVRGRYATENDLRRAWLNDTMTFDTAAPVNKLLTAMGADGGVFRDPVLPGVGAMPADYFEFLSGGILRFYLKLAAAIKEASGGRVVVGAYYGYDVVHLTGYNAGGGVLQNNNFESDAMLSNDLMDYYALVPSYGHRLAGSHYESQHTLATLRLHNRGYMAELDTRTFTAVARQYGRQRGARESVEVLKRDLATLMMAGYGGWFADWTVGGPRGVGYYMDPQLRDTIRRAKHLYETMLDEPRDSRAEIAVFVSGPAWFHHDLLLATPIYNNLIRRTLLEELTKIGAPYDIYRFEDLADQRVRERYKLFVFINPFAMDDAQRQTIDSLRADGKSTLWFYAPGYVHPHKGLSSKHVAAVTGMQVVARPTKEKMQYRLTDNGHAILAGTKPGATLATIGYGYPVSDKLHPPALGPVFHIDDPGATVLGEYPDGRAALAVKDRSVYCAAPYMNRELLRNIAGWAGVHLYTDAGPFVQAAGDMVMVHFGYGAGPVIDLRLPSRARVVDLFSGRQIAEYADEVSLPAQRCGTYFLRCD